MVYVLLLLCCRPNREDEPLAQPAMAETEAKATAMAEIVLFPRITQHSLPAVTQR